MRDSFIFYRSFFEATSQLENEQKAEFFDAICAYALNQKESKLSPIANALFQLVKPQLDANQKRYENGKKGGKPNQKLTKSKPKRNQNVTKSEPNVNVNDNVNGNVNANVNENKNVDTKDFSEEFAWVNSNAKSLVEMKTPLDEKTTAWFNDNFPVDVWHDVLESMENYPNIKKKYTSAKATAVGWLKRRGWLSYERMKVATYFEAKEIMGSNKRSMAIYANKNRLEFLKHN